MKRNCWGCGDALCQISFFVLVDGSKLHLSVPGATSLPSLPRPSKASSEENDGTSLFPPKKKWRQERESDAWRLPRRRTKNRSKLRGRSHQAESENEQNPTAQTDKAVPNSSSHPKKNKTKPGQGFSTRVWGRSCNPLSSPTVVCFLFSLHRLGRLLSTVSVLHFFSSLFGDRLCRCTLTTSSLPHSLPLTPEKRKETRRTWSKNRPVQLPILHRNVVGSSLSWCCCTDRSTFDEWTLVVVLWCVGCCFVFCLVYVCVSVCVIVWHSSRLYKPSFRNILTLSKSNFVRLLAALVFWKDNSQHQFKTFFGRPRSVCSGNYLWVIIDGR